MSFSSPPPGGNHGNGYGPPSGPYGTLYGAPPPAATFASYPPIAGPSIPPGPPGRKKSALPLVLGIAGGVVAVLLVAGGVAYTLAKKKAAALPVDATLLPAQTSEVSTQLIEATRETDEEVKRAYLAAELGAELCRPGASDPARRLEALGTESPKTAKELFFDKEKLAEVASLLECGSYLGASLDRPYQTVVAFEDGETKRHVAVAHFRFSTLPAEQGFSTQNYRGTAGYCRMGSAAKDLFAAKGSSALDAARARRSGYGTARPVAAPFGEAGIDGTTSPAPTTCDEADHGAFAQDRTWFLGRRAALDTMAHSVSRPKEELNSRLSALKEAASQTDGLPVMRLQASPKSSREFFMAPCYFGASQSAAPVTGFLEGCFPGKAIDATLAEIDAKLKAAAYETDGDVQKAGAFHGNLVFVARDDETAKEVEKEVREVVAEWKSHLDMGEAKLINDSRDMAWTTRQKKFAAVADRFFKALEHSEVKRKGRSIRVSFTEKLSAEDMAALEDADRTTVEKRRAVADVLDAIQAKKAIPEASLAKLVGASWAKYLAGPPPPSVMPGLRVMLSSDECKKLQARVAWFNGEDRAFDAPGARAMLAQHKYASCNTRALDVDDVQRACLASFKTAAEYAACASGAAATVASGEPPASEFGDRAKKR